VNRRTLALAGGLLLVACGRQDDLRPAPGSSMPVKPAAARETPSFDALLTRPPESRPGRSDELIRRSEERPDDRFELPPG
jgi:hypothetical protein